MLRGTDEQGPARQRLPVPEDHTLQHAVLSLQPRYRIFAQLDTLARHLFQIFLRKPTRAAGTQHQILGPYGETQSESHSFFTAPVDRDRLVPPLPSVAVGTMVHARAVELHKSIDLRQLIHHTSSQQQLAGGELTSIGADDPESIRRAGGIQYFDIAELDRRVARHLLSSELQEIDRSDAVAGQIIMQTLRASVPRAADIT